MVKIHNKPGFNCQTDGGSDGKNCTDNCRHHQEKSCLNSHCMKQPVNASVRRFAANDVDFKTSGRAGLRQRFVMFFVRLHCKLFARGPLEMDSPASGGFGQMHSHSFAVNIA
jgi:hypothetical protein